jgi:hypothetical protein
MRARTEEGEKYCRLSNVIWNGMITISSCCTESRSFSTYCLRILCSVSRVFNGNKRSLLTRESRGASGFYCVKFTEDRDDMQR